MVTAALGKSMKTEKTVVMITVLTTEATNVIGDFNTQIAHEGKS